MTAGSASMVCVLAGGRDCLLTGQRHRGLGACQGYRARGVPWLNGHQRGVEVSCANKVTASQRAARLPRNSRRWHWAQ